MKEGLDFIRRINIPKSAIENLLEPLFINIYVDLSENKLYYYTDKQIDVSNNFPNFIELFTTEIIKLKRDKSLNSLLKD